MLRRNLSIVSTPYYCDGRSPIEGCKQYYLHTYSIVHTSSSTVPVRDDQAPLSVGKLFGCKRNEVFVKIRYCSPNLALIHSSSSRK